MYGSFLLTNIKEALSRLVCRDERLKLFGEDFWVINKELKNICAETPIGEIVTFVKSNITRNVPWVYAFDIRAKLFRGLCCKLQEENGRGYDVEEIEVRRDYLLEDALEKIIGENPNPRKQW